jgi:hypothetical protein
MIESNEKLLEKARQNEIEFRRESVEQVALAAEAAKRLSRLRA